MSDTTNLLGMDPNLARNLIAFGSAAMQAANARTGQGFLAYGAGPLGAIGAGLQGMQQNQMEQAKLGSQLGFQSAQTQQLQMQNQLMRTEMQMYPQVMSAMQSAMGGITGPSGAPGADTQASQGQSAQSGGPVPVDQRAGLVNDAVKGTSVPPSLMGALVDHESNWDPQARSDKGALGVAQIMPATAANPGMGVAAADPGTLEGPGSVATNLKFGAQYLDALGKKNGLNSPDDWALNPDGAARALSMYYSGNANPTPQNVAYAGSILARAKSGWSGAGGSPSYQIAQAGNGPYPAPGPLQRGMQAPPANNMPALQMGAGQPQYGGGAPQYGGGPMQGSGPGNMGPPPPGFTDPRTAYNQATDLYNRAAALASAPQLPGMPNFAAVSQTLRARADQLMGYALTGAKAQQESMNKPIIMRNTAILPWNGQTIRSPEIEKVQNADGSVGYQVITPGQPGQPGESQPVMAQGAGGAPGGQALAEQGFRTQTQHEAYEEFAGPKELEGYQAANNTLGWLTQMDHSAETLNKNGGFLQTGPSAPERIAFASNVNDVLRASGLPPLYDPKQVAAWEELKKASVTAGFELASHYEGHARQAASTIVNATSAVPSAVNSPLGYYTVSAGIREAAQQAIDLHNYKQQVFNQNGDLVKAYTDFYGQNSPMMYAKRAISTVTPYTVTTDKDLQRFLPGTYVKYKNTLIQVPERPGAPPIPDYLKPQPQTGPPPVGGPQVPTQ